MRAAGWTVAVVDHRPFGGTCALRGCDPKKMLISGAEAIDAARRMKGRGTQAEYDSAAPAQEPEGPARAGRVRVVIGSADGVEYLFPGQQK